jgi:hypothetical protein
VADKTRALADFETFDPAACDAAIGLFRPEHIREIEHLHHISDEYSRNALRKKLGFRLWMYARGVTGQSGMGLAHLKQVNRILRGLHNEAHRLHGALDPLGISEHDIAVSEVVVMLAANGIDIAALLEALQAVQAVKLLPTEGGPMPDTDHHVLMLSIKGIFEKATGTKATPPPYNPIKGKSYGDFFRVAELVDAAAAAAVGQRPKTNAALGTALRRMLNTPDTPETS